jgi:hypothetical protein
VNGHLGNRYNRKRIRIVAKNVRIKVRLSIENGSYLRGGYLPIVVHHLARFVVTNDDTPAKSMP